VIWQKTNHLNIQTVMIESISKQKLVILSIRDTNREPSRCRDDRLTAASGRIWR
jgi:hypothetical protein